MVSYYTSRLSFWLQLLYVELTISFLIGQKRKKWIKSEWIEWKSSMAVYVYTPEEVNRTCTSTSSLELFFLGFCYSSTTIIILMQLLFLLLYRVV